jgi:phosphate-selective porin OprO/OprP
MMMLSAVLATGAVSAVIEEAAAAEQKTVEERIESAEEVIRQLQDEIREFKEQQHEAAARPAPPAEESPDTFRVFWKGGVRAETKDKQFTAKIGGRIQSDWAWGTIENSLQREVGDFKNGTEFRRARLYIEGTMYSNVEYKAQYDFAGGDADFKDVYLGMRKLPVIGNVRVGHFKEPFSLEELTSSKYITFLERSLPNAFVPGRNMGLMVHNAVLDQQMTWAVGTFRDTDDFGNNKSDGEFVFSGRLTGVPVYADKGRALVHVGASGRYRQPGDDELRFRERPENHLADRFVDTGTFAADTEASTGVELAVVAGPASLQSEWVYTAVDTPGSADPAFHGVYVFGSYFLTGEHRPYRRSNGTFSAVKPKRNFSGPGSGPGAWELAARYSEIDLTDEGIDGGKLRDTTVGVNWYLNPNVRLMANWVHADRESDGTADLFSGRFQVFF